MENLYKFNGNEDQEELGVFDFNFRTFDPTLERYFQIDTIIKFHESGYPWVTNNPIRFYDPLGLDIVKYDDPHVDFEEDVVLLDPIEVTASKEGDSDGEKLVKQKVGAPII